jgi:hypothetical protein
VRNEKVIAIISSAAKNLDVVTGYLKAFLQQDRKRGSVNTGTVIGKYTTARSDLQHTAVFHYVPDLKFSAAGSCYIPFTTTREIC